MWTLGAGLAAWGQGVQSVLHNVLCVTSCCTSVVAVPSQLLSHAVSVFRVRWLSCWYLEFVALC
jgi:hypothetical protein